MLDPVGESRRAVEHDPNLVIRMSLVAHTAEVGLGIADRFHGRGLGTHLLGLLAEVAHGGGITTFEGLVYPENHRMLEVFRESGFPIRMQREPGFVRIQMPTSLTPE